ncbi:tetratricopeptide repeat protein [Aneurinibacillus sp. BA2021]|nr:tetratricopeptide repeat protein [Aneurinibacillus sp. BA2021]
MLLSHYFAALTDKVSAVKARMAVAQEAELAELYQDVLRLRQISDRIVEEWIGFEEQLVELQRMFEGEDTESPMSVPAAELAQKDESGEEGIEEIYLPYALAATFRQGQGYFMLSMYSEAVDSFNRVLDEAPDVAVARLYLAFGFLMSRRLDVAYQQFRLLAETCDHAFICAASYNAMGCIAAWEGNAEQGLAWFERSLAVFPELTDACYNHALTLYWLERYEEAVTALAPLLGSKSEDTDALLLAGMCYVKRGKRKQAHRMLRRAEPLVRQANQRKGLACAYERIGRHADAARCYRQMLTDGQADASVWHGLGWSLWQTGEADKAFSYIKYALTLAPHQANYACSYAWILFCQGEAEKALHIFREIARKHHHPIARVGQAEVLLRNRQFNEAQGLIDELLAEKEPHLQSMGQYLQGKRLLLEGKEEAALVHFSASHASGTLREGGLYAGLVHYASGAHEEAYQRWQEWIPAP